MEASFGFKGFDLTRNVNRSLIYLSFKKLHGIVSVAGMDQLCVCIERDYVQKTR
jgi:hypothetical protein